ncbi:MAG: metallopeptidase family protein [Actinomycetota bacterium]
MQLPLGSREFEDLVDEALEELPEELAARISNLHIVIQDLPEPEDVEDGDVEGVLGLYEGVPLTERASDYYGFLPDRITLYKSNIESEAGTPDEVREVVRRTVIHEVAHHFGIDDDRLDELGWA